MDVSEIGLLRKDYYAHKTGRPMFRFRNLLQVSEKSVTKVAKIRGLFMPH